MTAKQILCVLLVWCSPFPISKGCGPIFDDFNGYSFISPDVMANAAKVAPFLLDFDMGSIFQYFGSDVYRKEQANLLEWQEKVCNTADLEDIRYVIYGTTREELLTLRDAIYSEVVVLPGTFKDNDFVDYLIDLKCEETVNYLVFAKSCEPHVIAGYSSWESPQRNVQAMDDLVRRGIREFRRTKSHYIKLRYAFQILRLAHYKGDFEEVLKLYDFLLPKTDERNSLIYYWLLGHKAGALAGLKQNVEASYLYTVIFKNAPERRPSAYRSFLIRSDEEWTACYNMCKDNEERAAMLAIRGVNAGNKVVEEMQNIYAFSPNSEFLEMMLIRAVRQLEQDLLGYPVGDGVRRHQRMAHKIPRDAEGDYVVTLHDFVHDARVAGNTKNPSLWYIIEGYLEFLAGDYYKAEQTLLKAAHNVKNEALKDQLHAITTVLKVALYEEMDSDIEDELYAISREEELWKNYPDFKQFFYDKVAQLYREAGRPGLAFRSHYGIKDLRYNPDLAAIDDLLETIDKGRTATRFEEILGKDTLGNDARLELLNIKATYLMSKQQYRKAQLVWKQMDRAEWDRFGQFSPFVERFKDCIDCEEGLLVIDTSSVFNKGEIVEVILKTDSEAGTGSENAALQYYNIGLGIYNMTYFGHEWKATDFYRSGASYASWNLDNPDGVVDYYGAPYGNKENFDVSRALSYFELAYEIANEEKKSELAARAAFMAAKCEQKQFYTSGLLQPNYSNLIVLPPEDYLKYFKVLKEQYDETDFYKAIIKECKYFDAYTRQ